MAVDEDMKITDQENVESVKDETEKVSDSQVKRDPVPAIMIVLIYAVIIGAVLFYFVPKIMAPSFGYDLDSFNAKLENSDISKQMNSQYTSLTPQFKLVDKESIKEIWSITGEISEEYQKKLDARFKPFVRTYAATEELENILVEANTRVNDGQLTRMCIYCTFDDSHMTMMLVHFGAVLSTFADIPFSDAVSLIMNSAMEDNAAGLYTVKGDIAYKLSAENVAGKNTYIKMEVLPAKSLKAEQIKTTIPAGTTASSETTASSSESTASSET